MKRNQSKKTRKISLVKGDAPFKYRLARTPKEHQENLELLFALQRIAYPSLNRGVRMNKKVFKLIRGKG